MRRADPQEERSLRQRVMRRVDEHGHLDLQPRLGPQRTDAEARRDDAHLADARIGQHRLGILLHDADERAQKRRAQSRDDQRKATAGIVASPSGRKRIQPSNPALIIAPLNTALAGTGAAGWASGSQKCRLKRARLDAKSRQQQQQRRQAEHAAMQFGDLGRAPG